MTFIDRLRRLFQECDAHVGTVADRTHPGKPAASRFGAIPVDDHLCFDVGNNVVNAAVTARGAVRVDTAR